MSSDVIPVAYNIACDAPWLLGWVIWRLNLFNTPVSLAVVDFVSVAVLMARLALGEWKIGGEVYGRSKESMIVLTRSTKMREKMMRLSSSLIAGTVERLHLAWGAIPSKDWVSFHRLHALVPAAIARIVVLLGVAISASAAQAGDTSQLTDVSDKEFTQRSRLLFDGTVLAGWEGKAYWFRTNDKTIIAGRLEKPIPDNQFLCTTDTFADFDLRLEVRMRGENPNAGVQFRSRRPRSSDGVPATEVVGYQADMGHAWGRSVWGGLYDESRRRKMLAEPKTPFDVKWTTSQAPATQSGDDSDDTKSAVPETEWVSMRIVCKGDQIEIFLNDQLTVRYTETDPEIPRLGVIGVQIHSGPPAEAEYRNIRVLSL